MPPVAAGPGWLDTSLASGIGRSIIEQALLHRIRSAHRYHLKVANVTTPSTANDLKNAVATQRISTACSGSFQMHRRLLVALLVACASIDILPRALAADVATATGFSKAEATVIANRFFATEIHMEAVVAEPSMQGDNWVFPLKVGYANRVAKDPILVNRFTGKASWAGLAEFNAMSGRNKAQTK